MIKTKQELLNHFSDINEMYNNPFMYQNLSNMIDELLEQVKKEAYIQGYDYGVKDWFKSKTQPCEDAISREAVIRLVEQYPNIIGNRCSGLIADIKHLPSVTPSYNSIKTELEPCEDAISREDALKAIEEQKKGFYGVERYAIDECHSAVMKLPSVRPYREIVEDKRACEKCIHYVTRDSKGVVLCGCDSWECDFEEVKT